MNSGQPATIAAIPLIAGTAALITTDKDAAKWLPNTPDQVKWSKRVSQIGAIYTLGGVVGGLMLVGKKKDEPEILHTGRLSARAFVNAVIVNYSLKYVTARERPIDNDGQGRFWKGGLVSLRTLDGILGDSHGDRPEQESQVVQNHYLCRCYRGQPLALGGSKHFPSDILAGGIMGGLIGNFVASKRDSSRMSGP